MGVLKVDGTELAGKEKTFAGLAKARKVVITTVTVKIYEKFFEY